MEKANQINVYTCPAGHQTITKNVDEGVTPMIIKCRNGCNEQAYSAGYRCDQTLIPSHVWYKPDAAELKTMSAGMREHIEMGGLALREVKKVTHSVIIPYDIEKGIAEQTLINKP